jgi:ankyrin repeat protein
VKTKEGWAPVHYTISHSSVEILGLLLARGAHVDSRNEGGATALHLAAGQGNLQAIRLLLNRGLIMEKEIYLEETMQSR